MNDSQLRETYLSGETIYDGKVVHLEKWEVLLPNGAMAAREVVKHVGAAASVPVDDEGFVTLVRQHRVAIDEVTLEIPAGKLNFKGEDPLVCAKRELEEETGLNAARWQMLTHSVTTPGFCTEQIGLFLATGLTQHEAHTDEDEFLNLVRLPLSEAVARVMAGEIRDMKSALGLLMADRVLRAAEKPFEALHSTIQRPLPPA